MPDKLKPYPSGMPDEIDCACNKEIVCPYCGKEQMDSWETSSSMSNGEQDTRGCEHCGKEFNFSIDMDITYNSWKLKDK